MTTPKRIQRKRTRGWRMPKGARYVGRGTVWGNPVVCTPHGCTKKPCGCCEAFRCCVDVYREWITSGIESRPSRTGSFAIAIEAMAGYPTRNEAVRRLGELRGKDLACWCRLCEKHKDGKPLGVECPDCAPCHADILLEIANG